MLMVDFIGPNSIILTNCVVKLDYLQRDTKWKFSDVRFRVFLNKKRLDVPRGVAKYIYVSTRRATRSIYFRLHRRRKTVLGADHKSSIIIPEDN